MKKIVLMTALVALVSCSSLTQGTNQKVAVITDPEGATCRAFQNDKQVSYLNSTPHFFVVDRLKYDLVIVCSKDGYKDARVVNKSGYSSMSYAGGLLGAAVDSATGADNSYDKMSFLKLEPQ